MSVEPSPHYGALQSIVEELFDGHERDYEIRRLDAVIAAEAGDLPDDLREVINLIPAGNYSRQRFCDQVNSIIGGHAWGQIYGTVE